jgi:tagaturonate reductase
VLLSKKNLPAIKDPFNGMIPPQSMFSLPEKVLQFGTGVFLRGLIDYYIDRANRENIFNGRVVVVKSTGSGETSAFNKQDGLYTLFMKSANNQVDVNETVICSAISRVMNANHEWSDVLECAVNPLIQVIISNTTETGITLLADDRISSQPPVSFPGKLIAFLFKRYSFFKGDPESGMVILPTELIPGNGSKLAGIVNELALTNNLDTAFINWMNHSCDFCNTLVDRIVPGKMPKEEHLAAEKKFGYEDELMIMSETYGLWAIETSSRRTRNILSFSKANQGIYIVENIYKFLELKLRLLNGSHNLSCALGFIAGFDTVKDAMANQEFDGYMRHLILDEIAASIVDENISLEDAKQFGAQVLERYRNPHINFKWLDICVQDTAKIKIRAVPIVQKHFTKYGYVPDCIVMGFAAYILFMKSEKNSKLEYIGFINGREYLINDDFSGLLHDKWKNFSGLDLVIEVLKDKSLWDTDLSILKGFPENVLYYLNILRKNGFFNMMENSSLKSPIS